MPVADGGKIAPDGMGRRHAKGQNMKPTTTTLALALIAAACTSDPGFTGVSGVREAATAAEVQHCRYITNISMTPGVFGPLATQGLKYARNTVKADAQAAGADTVLFDKVSPGADVYEVKAVAYRCAA